MWFDSWAEILRVLIIGSVSYAALVVLPGRLGVRARARSQAVVTAKPVALVVSGELRHAQLRKNRLSESEVLQAVRATGSGDLSDVAAVVLETNGSISVITKSKLGNSSALKGVQDLPVSEVP